MARAFLKVLSTTDILGTPPGGLVQVAVDEDGAPVELFWRKRIAAGDAEPHVLPDSSASEKSPSKKKGA